MAVRSNVSIWKRAIWTTTAALVLALMILLSPLWFVALAAYAVASWRIHRWMS